MRKLYPTLITGLFVITAAVAASAQQASVAPSDSLATPTLSPHLSLREAMLAPMQTPGGNVVVPAEYRALFCRFDDDLDRKGIPLRMRLGSLEEVNTAEGKPGYRATISPQ